MQARVRFVPVAGNPLRGSCVSSARNAGESAICPGPGQPSAGIVRVECAKCRRECDLALSRATLCADRACRVREMLAGESAILTRSGATLCGDRACRGREVQGRVRFVPVRRNPLRRSCVSRARSAGESAICPGPAKMFAEIVRVEGAKCSESAICPGPAQPSAEIVRELEDENWRLSSTTLVRGVSGELEDENWRLSSTTVVRGAICGAGS